MRHEFLSVANLEAEQITGAGALSALPGAKVWLNAALGSDGNAGTSPDSPLKTINAAYSKLTSGENDILYLVQSTGSISLSSTFTWSKNLTHLIGIAPAAFMNQRARIGMSTTFTPMITVSGYGNLFANLYTMHGTAEGDYVGWLISGNRNAFHNVHFGGPMNSSQAGHANYIGVHITGEECYFKNCTFGTSTIGRDEVTPNVKVGPVGRTVFENCLFQCYLTDGDPIFVLVDNSDTTEVFFKNCMFVALSANWSTHMNVAFSFTGAATAGCYFDSNCQFINVSAICDTSYDQFIWLPRQFVSTTDTDGMISVQLSI